jgi:hypothetical protein
MIDSNAFRRGKLRPSSITPVTTFVTVVVPVMIAVAFSPGVISITTP